MFPENPNQDWKFTLSEDEEPELNEEPNEELIKKKKK